MIKSQAKLSGVVSGNASVVNTKDGATFLSIPVKVTIPGSRKDSPSKDVSVSVTVNGTSADVSAYPVGSCIEASGTLNFRKRGDNLYLNFHADTVSVIADGTDGIEGTLSFKGTVGNKIDARTDKKGKPFVSFSAFSTDKVGENFEFIWVRFVKFDETKPVFLAPKSKIEATGEMSLSIYNDRLSIECRYDNIRPWEKMPFYPTKPGEEAPF